MIEQIRDLEGSLGKISVTLGSAILFNKISMGAFVK